MRTHIVVITMNARMTSRPMSMQARMLVCLQMIALMRMLMMSMLAC